MKPICLGYAVWNASLNKRCNIYSRIYRSKKTAEQYINGYRSIHTRVAIPVYATHYEKTVEVPLVSA